MTVTELSKSVIPVLLVLMVLQLAWPQLRSVKSVPLVVFVTIKLMKGEESQKRIVHRITTVPKDTHTINRMAFHVQLVPTLLVVVTVNHKIA